jgi:hypothetical protein
LICLSSITVALVACGCDIGTGHDEPIDAPPVHVLELLVTTSVDGAGQPQREPASPDAITTVLATTSLTLRFDRFLLPSDAALRQSVCLQPKVATVRTIEDCTNRVMLNPSYDPVWRTVTFRQDGARLLEDTVYQLTLLVPTEEQPFGFRAFDGAPLEEPPVFQLKPVATTAADEVPSTEDVFCHGSFACRAPCAGTMDPQGCEFNCALRTQLGGCAYSPCHASATDTQGKVVLGPAAGLDLSTPEFILLTAIGHTAHQTQSGEHAQDDDNNPSRFGRAMPIIDPGDAGNSYLLYKLFVTPTYAQSAAAPADPKELLRLHRAVVVGMPMPPPPDRSIELVSLTDLSTWITQNAPTTPCFP